MRAGREPGEALTEVAPRYAGPADNPYKNTVADLAENPDFYLGVSASLQDSIYNWGA